MTRTITQPKHVVSLIHAGEWYSVVYDRQGEVEALATLGRWASDQSLSFMWFAAAAMSEKIRALGELMAINERR